MTRQICITPGAQVQVEVINAWWSQHRPAAPFLFLDELAAAKAVILAAPRIGRRYRDPRVRDVRRFLLRAARYHVYYKQVGETVYVIAVWHAVRGSGPRLESP